MLVVVVAVAEVQLRSDAADTRTQTVLRERACVVIIVVVVAEAAAAVVVNKCKIRFLCSFCFLFYRRTKPNVYKKKKL